MGHLSFGLMKPKLSYLIIVTDVRFGERRIKTEEYPLNCKILGRKYNDLGLLFFQGTGMIHIIKEHMNDAIYWDILEENLFKSV